MFGENIDNANVDDSEIIAIDITESKSSTMDFTFAKRKKFVYIWIAL